MIDNSTNDSSKFEELELYFNARMKFLRESWHDHRHMRFFDTIQTSREYLIANSGFDMLVRLSSTMPGNVTVSRKEDGTVRHRRFKINLTAAIIDDDGEEHKNVAKFVTGYSMIEYNKTRVMYLTGGYVRSILE